MSTIALTTGKDFDYQSFVTSVRTSPFGPTNKVKFFDDKIVVIGDDGCSVEFYGDNLKPNKFSGVITSGVFKIDGVVVAEISDVSADISTNQWKAAVLTKGYAPVSYVLGANHLKDDTDEEFTFLGGKGDDTISGEGDAANFLFGGKGDDYFLSRADETYFDGGKGYDLIDYGAADDDVPLVVSLADASQNRGAAAGHSYNSIEDLRGGIYDDKLIGDDEGNRIDGNLGSDTIIGGAGRDTLSGGEQGKNDFDYVSYEGMKSSGGVGYYVDLSTGTALGGGVSDANKPEKLSGFEGVIGSSFQDFLIGDKKANVLRGEDGSDRLVGGLGADTLRGDEEAFGFRDSDIFEYRSAKEGGDTILDYDIFDKVAISQQGFGLSKSFKFVDDLTFIKDAGAEAVSKKATFLFDTDTSKLWFDADGTGKGKAVLLANVKYANPDSIDVSDFFLVA